MKRAVRPDSIAAALGLKTLEVSVIEQTIHARTLTPSGDYLCTANLGRAALRMIERGFLTRVPPKMVPPPPADWIVVRFTERNRRAMNKAAQDARAASEKPRATPERSPRSLRPTRGSGRGRQPA